jgi:hypothetical protein
MPGPCEANASGCRWPDGLLGIDVPRSWLKRHGGAAQALWYCVRDVTPQHFRRIITFGERSPVEEAAGR